MKQIIKTPFIRYLKYYLQRMKIKKENLKCDLGYMSTVQGSYYFEEYVSIARYTQLLDVEISRHTYVGDYGIISNCKIGRYCSIANNVVIAPGQHPSNTFISTSPIFYSKVMPQMSFTDKEYFDNYGRKVIIGNDVWIGNNVHIMQGVKIGDGAIIASNAVVTKDVEPYVIVGGVPAKPIKKRFSDEEIEQLLKLKWWDFDQEFLKGNFKLFHNIRNKDEIVKKWNEYNEK